jgi:hypothetical protein
MDEAIPPANGSTEDEDMPPASSDKGATRRKTAQHRRVEQMQRASAALAKAFDNYRVIGGDFRAMDWLELVSDSVRETLASIGALDGEPDPAIWLDNYRAALEEIRNLPSGDISAQAIAARALASVLVAVQSPQQRPAIAQDERRDGFED